MIKHIVLSLNDFHKSKTTYLLVPLLYSEPGAGPPLEYFFEEAVFTLTPLTLSVSLFLPDDE